MHLNSNVNIEHTQKGINEACAYMINVLHFSASKYIPSSVFRPYLKPYWKLDGLHDLHFEMRRTRRKWMQAGRPREKSSEIRAKYKNAKQSFRRKLRNASRNWKKKD